MSLTTGGDQTDQTDHTTATPRASRRRRSWLARRHPVTKVVLAGLVVFALLVGFSISRALRAPGTDSVAARLAEWGRGHGLSPVIDRLERATYHAPAVGGKPAATSPLVTAAPPQPAVANGLPSAIAPLAPAPLPHEGQWEPLTTVGGVPAIEAAYLRPDAIHTSYTAGVVRMDQSRVRFELHPGTQEPGHGPWSLPPVLSGAARGGLVAAFNSAFRVDAARGGFYLDGRTVGTLRTGAASFVIDRQGRASIGVWGRDVRMSSNVVAVRQNLDLLVDGGAPVAGLDTNAGGRWGATLGNRLFVWRSGVGITKTGAIIYVAGDRLSASSIAELLRRAGSIRAMELDINPEWTSFVSYPKEQNLLPTMQRKASRYDTTGTRDFFAVHVR